MKPERLLGIDFGEANIGLAFGLDGLTMPLATISGKNLDTATNELIRISFENKIDKAIVGLPVTPDGKETPKSLEVRKFVKFLKTRYKKPIEFVDEHSSTKEALDYAISTDVSQKKRKHLDSISAEIILRRYFRK